MPVIEKAWLWVASAAFISLVGLAAYMYVPASNSDNHHTIVSVTTDHPGDRCYMLLDSQGAPVQMSCVAGEKPRWTTYTTTAQW